MSVALWVVLAWAVLLVGFVLGWLTCIALHESGTVRSIAVGPDDLLVLQSEKRLSAEQIRELKDQWEKAACDGVAVIAPGIDLTVVHGGRT